MESVIGLPWNGCPVCRGKRTAILRDDIDALKALLHVQQAAHETAVKVAIAAAVDAATDTVKREAQGYVQRMIEQRVLARHRQFGASPPVR